MSDSIKYCLQCQGEGSISDTMETSSQCKRCDGTGKEPAPEPYREFRILANLMKDRFVDGKKDRMSERAGEAILQLLAEREQRLIPCCAICNARLDKLEPAGWRYTFSPNTWCVTKTRLSGAEREFSEPFAEIPLYTMDQLIGAAGKAQPNAYLLDVLRAACEAYIKESDRVGARGWKQYDDFVAIVRACGPITA